MQETAAIVEEIQQKYFSVEEAADILGLQYSQTRALLGEPESQRVTPAGHIQFLFTESKVLSIKGKREEYIRKRLDDLGKKACYFCQTRFPIKELTSGICSSCQAKKIVKNFATHGRFFSHSIDRHRLELLRNAIDEILSQDGKDIG